MFGVLGWILFGLVVGIVAKLLMPGRDPGGIIVTMMLGIIGAVVGGFVGRALGSLWPEEPAGFLMSLVGAIALLAIYRLVARRTAVTSGLDRRRSLPAGMGRGDRRSDGWPASTA